jgi:hypothetical protein
MSIERADSFAKNESAVFDPQSLGASFQELAVDVIETDDLAFISRWFRSNHSDADLLIWCDGESRILKHQLSFFGQVVEWNAIEGTRTGMIVEEEIKGSGLSDDGELQISTMETIVFDKKVQASAVEQAILLIQSLKPLKGLEKSTLVSQLKYSSRLGSSARERALKAWEGILPELYSKERPQFWRRIKGWLKGR